MENDTRWKQRFDNFSKAFKMLNDFIEKENLNKFEEQGLIQCFEYTFELAWKTLKDYLEKEGYDLTTPRETIQKAFKIQFISTGHDWIDALDKRNLMTHTYNENSAKEALSLIRDKYYFIIKELYLKLSGLL